MPSTGDKGLVKSVRGEAFPYLFLGEYVGSFHRAKRDQEKAVHLEEAKIVIM